VVAARADGAGARTRTLRDGRRFIQPPGREWRDGVAGGQRRGNRRGGATETDKRTDAVLAVTSFPLARQNGRTIDRATTDECVSPSQTSANNVRKQCPRRQNRRLERAGRLRTGHRRFRRHTVSETGGFPPHTDGQGCEGLFSHLPTVHRCRVAA